MCNGFDSNNLLRHSKSTYRSRLHNIPVVVTLLPHSSQPRAVLQQWLDGISQLSHPHVLPVVAACLEPAAVICPLVKVGLIHWKCCQQYSVIRYAHDCNMWWQAFLELGCVLVDCNLQSSDVCCW